jgi:hypothetical protein
MAEESSPRMKEFLVAAINSALELGIGTPEDVLFHVTPDVLSQHLPRPLWARLITACLGAPKVNAALVVDTIGMTNLCEHMPGTIMWNVLSDIGQRALGRMGTVLQPMPTSKSQPTATAASDSRPTALPQAPQPGQPPQPPPPGDGRGTSRPPFRSQVGAGAASRSAALSPGASSRRPQAPAQPPAPAQPMPPASALVGSRVTPPNRGTTSTDFEIDTDIRSENWKSKEVEVDDDLIEWAGSEETVTGGPDGFGSGTPLPGGLKPPPGGRR